jgi:uncharacterized membrane protein YgcG
MGSSQFSVLCSAVLLFLQRRLPVGRFFRLAAVLVLLLLMASPAFAQGRLIIVDPEGYLDRGAIEAAARPLLNRGAEVAVYMVQSGGDADFVNRLIDDDLARDSATARSGMIALYVALDERFSSIRYGDGWNAALSTNNNVDQIRENDFNPDLADGHFTAAYVSALEAIDAAIANPPQPGGGTVINVDPGEVRDNILIPVAAGGAAIAAGTAGAVVYSRRRKTRAAFATAEASLKEARENAATLITDLGQRFRSAEEKLRFDKVTYTAEASERLSNAQRKANVAFVDVQGAFKAAGEALERYERPTIPQIEEATVAYGEVTTRAQAVSEQLQAVETTRAELDALARQANEEIDRAKKA